MVVRQIIHWLISYKSSSSPQMVKLMMNIVLAHTVSMLMAATCSILVAWEVHSLSGAIWPLYWIAGEIVIVGARSYLIQKARTIWSHSQDAIIPYIVTSLAWSLMIGIATFLCAISNYPVVVLLGLVVVIGLLGAITARNSPIPRMAVTQLLLVSGPYVFGLFLNFKYWEGPIAIIVIVGVFGMVTLVEHHYNQVVSLISAERKNAYMAHHDMLTGLANRTGFHEHLESMLRQHAESNKNTTVPWFIILCFDLDGFKGVNDTLGHAAGDAVLKGVADRLNAEIGTDGFIARLSGDEFAAILPGITTATAQELATRIIDRVSVPFDFGAAWPVHVNTSIGIASVPAHGTEATVIMSRADAALYAAKAAGKGISYLFQPGLDHTDMLTDLREALHKSDQLVLYYQPILSTKTNKIVGREALLRWRHPKMGLLPPDDFVPIAERSRLIVPLGAKIIQMACEEAMRWPDDARVSVNVSSRQLGERGLVDAVSNALQLSGLPAARLEIEILETSPILRTPQALTDLNALRNLGVLVALDDFPSGYSTLAALSWFQFDRIKLDGPTLTSATQTHEGIAVLKASVNLARELGMEITAEGVETELHLSVAKMLGADEVQGYLLGHPVASPTEHATSQEENSCSGNAKSWKENAPCRDPQT